MTPVELRFFARARARLYLIEPELRNAILTALAAMRDLLPEGEVARLIETGDIAAIVTQLLSDAAMARALWPVRQRLRYSLERGFRYATADLPNAGKVDGLIGVAFDHLSPNVVAAIRALESGALGQLAADIREVVRAFVENGLRDGRSPLAVARELRNVIGLGPTQWQQVANFRAALEEGDVAKALGYTLRDKRYDQIVKRGAPTPAQIERMVAAYERRRIAQNAATVAKTVAFDAYKQGQALAWQDAREKGVIPDGYVTMKQWKHLAGQLDPRLTHEAMDGEVRPADQRYSNGDAYAGEGDPWGCHCLDRFFIQKVA